MGPPFMQVLSLRTAKYDDVMENDCFKKQSKQRIKYVLERHQLGT